MNLYNLSDKNYTPSLENLSIQVWTRFVFFLSPMPAPEPGGARRLLALRQHPQHPFKLLILICLCVAFVRIKYVFLCFLCLAYYSTPYSGVKAIRDHYINLGWPYFKFLKKRTLGFNIFKQCFFCAVNE